MYLNCIIVYKNNFIFVVERKFEQFNICCGSSTGNTQPKKKCDRNWIKFKYKYNLKSFGFL